jgi:hypothetical protein
MKDPLDSKEAYLYSILFILTKEQLAALEKQLKGHLGLWGKWRLKSRMKEIQKIIFHLFDKKNIVGEPIVPKILADFEFIATDTETWADVTSEEINYLRKVLTQIA